MSHVIYDLVLSISLKYFMCSRNVKIKITTLVRSWYTVKTYCIVVIFFKHVLFDI